MIKITLIFLIVSLLFIASCTSYTPTEKDTRTQAIITSADDPGPEGSIHNLPKGCFVMKKLNAEEFECFGCVQDNCKEENLEIWDYYDQDLAKEKGFSCKETESGCELFKE